MGMPTVHSDISKLLNGLSRKPTHSDNGAPLQDRATTLLLTRRRAIAQLLLL
jgi:hypothetical protein